MIDVGLLKGMSNLERFQSGQMIIEDGETMCEEMYILLKGSVDIYKNYQEPNEIKIATVEPGGFFGEMSLFLNKERTATVVANQEVIVLTINRTNAFEFFERQPVATFSLIKTLCSRLVETNAAYKKIYAEMHPEIALMEEEDILLIPWLLPDGHKAYRRKVNLSKIPSLVERSYGCPLCETSFTASIGTLSHREPTYHYLRPGKGVSDFYYEAVTCPNCWYSGLIETFSKPDIKGTPLFERYMESDGAEVRTMLDDQTGIGGIFVKYFLALKSVPKVFKNYQEMMARIWIRLSWLYYDCKDEKMEAYAIKQAQEAYIAATGNREIGKEELMSVNFAIGQLSMRNNELQMARQYFEIVAGNSADPDLKKQAAESLEDVKQRAKDMVSMMRAK